MSNRPLRPVKRYQEDPNHTIKSVWLDDPTYAAAMTAFVLVCTDAVIVDRRRRTIWLATRAILPMRGLWVIGGRRLAGETIAASIQRCFARETSLTIPRERFKYLRQNEYLWSTRQQLPQDVGSHNLVDVFAIQLKKEEREAASRSLVGAEYEPVGLQEFSRRALLDANVHEALVDLYDSVF